MSYSTIQAATNAMLQIRGGADKIMFVDPQPDLNGKTLAQVSRERELTPAAAVQQEHLPACHSSGPDTHVT